MRGPSSTPQATVHRSTRARDRAARAGHRTTVHPYLTAALARRGGVLTTSDAQAAGHTRHHIAALVRGGQWRTLRYGVHTTAPIWADHARAGREHRLTAAAVLARLGRPGVALSHGTAARFHDLLLPGGLDDTVTATDPHRFRTGRGYRVLAAGLPDDDVEAFPPHPVTTLRRTLLDVGREWDPVATVVALDDALADGRISVADLTTGVLGQTHWVGIGSVAQAVRLARVGSHSPLETLARLGLVALGLPEPVLQAAVLREGRLIAVLDLWWRGTPAFGEVDGRVKWTTPLRGRTPADVGWEEKRRHDALLDLGLTGVRIAQADIDHDLPAKAARLRTLMGRPLELPTGVQIVRWNEGLRRSPRAFPWSVRPEDDVAAMA